jgi:hypothetical protein
MMTIRHLSHLVSTALVALTAAPTLAAAQDAPRSRIEIAPFVGAYAPLGTLAERGGVELKEQTGLALGVRGSFPAGDRLAIEGVLGYVSHDISADGLGADLEGGARILLAGARASMALAGAGSSLPIHGSLGLALLSRGGDAYEEVEGTTDLAAVIGVGTRLRLTERWMVRVDLEDYISSAGFSFGDGETDSKLVNGLVLSAGVVVPIGR